jgi:hypothetical protein
LLINIIRHFCMKMEPKMSLVTTLVMVTVAITQQ